jgi:tetrahydrodipicolinate N-succinyltransferase
MFGWIAVCGEAAEFSGGVGIGGVALPLSGSVIPARIVGLFSVSHR